MLIFNALIELEEDMTVSEKYDALIDINERTALARDTCQKEKEGVQGFC